MNETSPEPTRTCHYFVDEAGDGTLFNKRKQVVVGREGCSSYFILGVLEIAEPKALQNAIEHARNNLRASWGIEATSPIEIMAAKPADAGGLQAVDYMLWALQRLYERGEERYWEYVAAKARLVHDVDDTRVNGYGVYYTKKNPLKKESLKK